MLQWETDPLVTTIRSRPLSKGVQILRQVWSSGAQVKAVGGSHTCHLCHTWLLHSQQDLFRVLKAYTLYRPEEGYCQAQAPIAAVLLMHMPAEVPPGPGWVNGRAGNTPRKGLTSLLLTASLLVPGADL